MILQDTYLATVFGDNLENGEPDRIRTCDPLIKSQLLYQLSYGPTPRLAKARRLWRQALNAAVS